MYSDRYDYFVYLTLLMIRPIFGSDVRPVFGPMLGQRSGRWASIGPALGWCPVFAGRVSTLCWFNPSTHQTLDQCWFEVGPVSSTVDHHHTNIGPMYRVSWDVGPCLRRCPGTAPTLGRSWCLLAFTILCNNVTFWLSRSAYMFF